MAENIDNWEACPEGALVGLRGRLRRETLRKKLAAAAAAVALGGLLVTAGLLLAPNDQQGGELACDQVRTHLAAYVSGELGEPLRRQMAAHLDHCPLCRKRMEEMQRQGRQESHAPPSTVTASILPWPR